MNTPLQAIRAKCLDCCCGQSNEVKECPSESCPLYPFRTGKKPKVKKELSQEQYEALVKRMAKARQNKKSNKKGESS